jgi:hypothetical protein
MIAHLGDERRQELIAELVYEQLRRMIPHLNDERRQQLLRLLQEPAPPPSGKRKRK